jgi:STAS domain
VIRIAGELDFATVPPVTTELRRLLAGSGERWLIDLTPVTFLGSAGITMLFAVHAEHGSRLARSHLVAPVGNPARRSLQIARVDECSSFTTRCLTRRPRFAGSANSCGVCGQERRGERGTRTPTAGGGSSSSTPPLRATPIWTRSPQRCSPGAWPATSVCLRSPRQLSRLRRRSRSLRDPPIVSSTGLPSSARAGTRPGCRCCGKRCAHFARKVVPDSRAQPRTRPTARTARSRSRRGASSPQASPRDREGIERCRRQAASSSSVANRELCGMRVEKSKPLPATGASRSCLMSVV